MPFIIKFLTKQEFEGSKSSNHVWFIFNTLYCCYILSGKKKDAVIQDLVCIFNEFEFITDAVKQVLD